MQSFKLKIVYIISTLQRCGPVNILFFLLRALDRDRFEPFIVTLSPEPHESRWKEFEELGIEVRSLNLSRVGGLLKCHSALAALLKQINPDVIHLNCFRSICLARWLSRRYRTLATLQNNPFDDYTMLFGKAMGYSMATLLSWNVRCLSGIVACSSAVARSMQDRCHREIRVINNGIDLAKPRTTAMKHAARERLQIPHTRPVFIYIANLVERKNHATLLEAFLTPDLSQTASLIIVGDGELYEKYRTAAKGVGHILFFGHVADIYPYLYASDFYVSTSLSEGFPTAVMQAMSIGLPPLLSKIEPHEEMLAPITGFRYFFDPLDSEELSARALDLCCDDYHHLSREVATAVVSNYSSDAMVRKYEQLYVHLSASK